MRTASYGNLVQPTFTSITVDGRCLFGEERKKIIRLTGTRYSRAGLVGDASRLAGYFTGVSK